MVVPAAPVRVKPSPTTAEFILDVEDHAAQEYLHQQLELFLAELHA